MGSGFQPWLRCFSKSSVTQRAQPKAELLEAHVEPFCFVANGKIGQEVSVTWKNVGEIPVRVVHAEIMPKDTAGRELGKFTYTIYVEYDAETGVMPGEAHTTPPGYGFKLPGFHGLLGYVPAESVDVRITKVATSSGL